MSIKVENCNWLFKFQCPMKWDSLAPGSHRDIRVCGVCLRNVYLCGTDAEVKHHASQGHCVAVQPAEDDCDQGMELLGEMDFG